MHLVMNDKLRKSRKMYTAAFKEKVAKAFLNTSATYSEIARKFGVTCPQVARWTREYDDPSCRWVKELCKLIPNENSMETNLLQEEKTECEVKENNASFNVDVSLPSGTKIYIHNINTDQLQNVLKLCQSMQ